MELSASFSQKRVLITGGAGTVGKALVRHILRTEADDIRVFDNNETELFYVAEEFRSDPRVTVSLGDIRDKDKLVKSSRGVDIVFHAAAYKHVILSEFNPFDVIQTNIAGTQNVIEAAFTNGVNKVIFTSSDKAVNPTNVMGASKLMAEKLITAANAMSFDKKTIFASTRFGNVLGSRGSVVPIFVKQIAKGGPLTLTDARMTRFVMTIDEAVRLVIESCSMAKGGEVFITKMPVIRIVDLAHTLIDILGNSSGARPVNIQITEIGKKPGEKLYEELMSMEEMGRAVEMERLFAVLPAFRNLYNIEYSYDGIINSAVGKPYVSSEEAVLSRDELRSYIEQNRVLEEC